MRIYVIGDLHLALDPRIDKPMDVFGPAWANHDQRVKENWTAKIHEDDLVVLPGDISWGLKIEEAMADFEFIHNLPGKKVIFKGNHDLWWTGLKKMNALFDSIEFVQNNCYMAGNIAICGTRGWTCPGSEGFEPSDEKIYKRELLRLEMSLEDAKKQGATEIIGFLHYPPTNEKKQLSGFTKMFEEYGVKQVYYGHLHGDDAKRNRDTISLNGTKYRLVSLDAIDCDPVLIRE